MDQDADQILHIFWISFLLILTPSWLPYIKNQSQIIEKSSKNPSKIYQNQLKINQKIIKISSWAPKGSKTPPRPFQARKQEESGILPGHPFGELFRPCWPPTTTKRPPKKHTPRLIRRNFLTRNAVSQGQFLSSLANKKLRLWAGTRPAKICLCFETRSKPPKSLCQKTVK